MAALGGSDDDMLSQFVKPDFDSKDFVHTVVRRNSVSDDLSHLRQGIAVLESQLREQVVSHHGRLIEQVSHAKDLEVLVDTVTSGVSRLQASLGSVKAKIREPYEVVANKTAQLERMQVAHPASPARRQLKPTDPRPNGLRRPRPRWIRAAAARAGPPRPRAQPPVGRGSRHLHRKGGVVPVVDVPCPHCVGARVLVAESEQGGRPGNGISPGRRS
jgi:hypothetical protein